jgi:hypothetical protein
MKQGNSSQVNIKGDLDMNIRKVECYHLKIDGCCNDIAKKWDIDCKNNTIRGIEMYFRTFEMGKQFIQELLEGIKSNHIKDCDGNEYKNIFNTFTRKCDDYTQSDNMSHSLFMDLRTDKVHTWWGQTYLVALQLTLSMKTFNICD